MAEFEEREARKFNELGPQLGGMATAIVEADAVSKQRTLQRQVEILGMDNLKPAPRPPLSGATTRCAWTMMCRSLWLPICGGLKCRPPQSKRS